MILLKINCPCICLLIVCTLFSSPRIYLSVLSLSHIVLSIVRLKLKWYKFPNFVIFQDYLVIIVPLLHHINFSYSLSLKKKTKLRNFERNKSINIILKNFLNIFHNLCGNTLITCNKLHYLTISPSYLSEYIVHSTEYRV